ncbi:MAG: DUF433 domain-containing protein [Thermoplasmatota archaeon]
METFTRITIHPDLLGGQPCIREMRIPVSLIVKLVAAGKTANQIMDDYPELEKEDIRQALEFAAWMTSEKTVPTTTLYEDISSLFV